jgi:peptidoglycan/xylan/chitin deacetylase (PgdA/CDA1 family)
MCTMGGAVPGSRESDARGQANRGNLGGPLTAMAGSVVNLTVHGIGPTPRLLDPGEGHTWITVEQFERMLDAVVDRPDVQLTFDDGNASDVEIGLPKLLERGLSAEFFVLTGLLGQRGRLDAADVRELHQAGMRVGSHGWAHRDWRRIHPSLHDQEFGDARRVLAELIGSAVSRVAIPFGSYDRHVLRHLRQTGVTRVFTSDGGRGRPESWLQPRTSLRADTTPQWIRSVLDGRPSLARRARGVAVRTLKRVRG